MASEQREGSAGEEDEAIARLVAAQAFRDAIARCAEVYGAALGRFCMAQLGSQAEAEEIVQETLVAAYQGMARFRGEGSVRGWLYGIARHLCARRIETRVRREGLLREAPWDAFQHEADEESSEESLLVRQERAALMRALLAELKPSERDALLLRYESGLSYREIATSCQIDESAARKRTSRALARLRELWKAGGKA